MKLGPISALLAGLLISNLFKEKEKKKGGGEDLFNPFEKNLNFFAASAGEEVALLSQLRRKRKGRERKRISTSRKVFLAANRRPITGEQTSKQMEREEGGGRKCIQFYFFFWETRPLQN